ncbi:MAG: CsbD family protein [Armatimonadetes bacterium]|nr:CsbD family protein [Armatimonadota bacterium]
MTRDQFEGSWYQFKGVILEQWGKLTDDDFDRFHGDWDQLVGWIQREYGLSREDVERRLHDIHVS